MNKIRLICIILVLVVLSFGVSSILGSIIDSNFPLFRIFELYPVASRVLLFLSLIFNIVLLEIIRSSKVNTHSENPNKLADRKLYKEVTNILSSDAFYALIGQLGGHHYNQEHYTRVIYEYLLFAELPDKFFHNKKLNVLKTQLDQSLLKLDNFVVNHFFSLKASSHFSLETELKERDYTSYRVIAEELYKLLDEVKKNFDTFLIESKKILKI